MLLGPGPGLVPVLSVPEGTWGPASSMMPAGCTPAEGRGLPRWPAVSLPDVGCSVRDRGQAGGWLRATDPPGPNPSRAGDPQGPEKTPSHSQGCPHLPLQMPSACAGSFLSGPPGARGGQSALGKVAAARLHHVGMSCPSLPGGQAGRPSCQTLASHLCRLGTSSNLGRLAAAEAPRARQDPPALPSVPRPETRLG